MKLSSKLIMLTALFAIFGVMTVMAQRPRASQKASVEQTVGSTVLSMTYHRPNKKGRVLWGDTDALVPNGKVWRSGANNATVFETSEKVMIEGQELAAGKYSFYTIPGESEWTLIFNKTWEQWGTNYDEKTDALRVKVKPMMSSEDKESMNYVFEDVQADSVKLVLEWGKARIAFNVATTGATEEK